MDLSDFEMKSARHLNLAEDSSNDDDTQLSSSLLESSAKFKRITRFDIAKSDKSVGFQWLQLPFLLAPIAVGQRAYVMPRCPSCVRPSIRALTVSLNIFFSETACRILMKFHRNVPAMVLFKVS